MLVISGLISTEALQCSWAVSFTTPMKHHATEEYGRLVFGFRKAYTEVAKETNMDTKQGSLFSPSLSLSDSISHATIPKLSIAFSTVKQAIKLQSRKTAELGQ